MGPAWRRIVQVIGARWGWEPRRARALGQWGDLFQPRFCASVTSKISMEVAHTAVEKLSSSHSGSSPIFNGLHDRGSSRQAPAQLDVSTSLAFVACDADHRIATICVGGHWRASAPRPSAQVRRPCTPDGTRLGRCRQRRFMTRNTSAPSLTGLRLTPIMRRTWHGR